MTDMKPTGEALPETKVTGVLAEFETPQQLVKAASKVRKAGYTKFDAHSPFPIHGMDEAVGIRRTILPIMAFVAGISGTLIAFGFQYWANGVDYAMNISGKPLWAWPANVPVAFEVTVLLAGLTTFFGVLGLNGLPELYRSLFLTRRFSRATADRFFIFIDADDPRFIPNQTSQFLEGLKPLAVETCRMPVESGQLPAAFMWVGIVAALVAVLWPFMIWKARFTHSSVPRLHVIFDMDFQEKYLPQSASVLFSDDRAARLPIAGTVARGTVIDNEALLEGREGEAYLKTLPESLQAQDLAALMARGQARFGIYCAPCHGYNGGGKGVVAERAIKVKLAEDTWNPPTSLYDPRIVKQDVGEIFKTITHGVRRPGAKVNSMPQYGDQIPPEDRWAIVLYVRALQRAYHAKLEDVPPAKQGTLDTQRAKQ